MKEEIGQLERARFQAMLDGDVDALDKLYSDRLVYLHSSGDRDGKQSYLDQLRSGSLTYPQVTIPDPEVHVSGGAAVVFGRMKAEAVRDGKDRSLDYDYMSVWAKEDGGWRLLAQQPRPKVG